MALYQQLLAKAKDGIQLTPEELEDVRSQLASGDFKYDPYTLLHILGKARDLPSLPIIMRYVNPTTTADDPMLRRIALQVVGRMWALPEAFELALDKAFNDSSADVRSAAATILGFLGAMYPQLRQRSAAAIVEGLRMDADPDDYTWRSFYNALLELSSIPVSNWPLPMEPLTEDKIDRELIEKAKVLAKTADHNQVSDPK